MYGLQYIVYSILQYKGLKRIGGDQADINLTQNIAQGSMRQASGCGPHVYSLSGLRLPDTHAQ